MHAHPRFVSPARPHRIGGDIRGYTRTGLRSEPAFRGTPITLFGDCDLGHGGSRAGAIVRICHVGDVPRCRYGHDAVMAHTEMNLANSDVSQTIESELPTGTVTFLLTDIEGSTKLWEAGADEDGSLGSPSLRVARSGCRVARRCAPDRAG